MTRDQFNREQNYRTAMALAKMILRDGIIQDEEYQQINTIMLEKFQPILAGLYPRTT